MTNSAREIVSIRTDKNDEPVFAYCVGINGVTEIALYEQNLGDHAILWFHVRKGEVVVASVTARSVERVLWDVDAGTQDAP